MRGGDEEEILETNDLVSVPVDMEKLIVSYDFHPNKDLRDYFNWNLQCLVYAALFEIGVIIQYTVWQVALAVCLLALAPKIANLAWLLIRYRDKRRAVLSNRLALIFYVLQVMLFLGFVSCATYFFASTCTHDYDDFSDWEV